MRIRFVTPKQQHPPPVPLPAPAPDLGAGSAIEDLLTRALEVYEAGGETAVDELLRDHPEAAAIVRQALADLHAQDLFGQGPRTPERLGDFQLGQRLGSGGMGVVYAAEQLSLGRRVAVKVVRPELLFLDGARERFRREIDAVARLEHPAIVPILACGEADGRPYYAMPWIPGCTADEVTRRLRDRDPASLRGIDLLRAIAGPDATDANDPDGQFAGRWWQACTTLVRQVALGIAHAHRRGILHRDLKPSNVMLTPDGRALVLDFGLAHVRGDQRLTRTGSEPGTPAWMAPEQLRGHSADERTDVYGLAAILHQLLTLQPPFPLGDSEVLRGRILAGERLPLRDANPVVPRDLAIVLDAAMDVDRERRHADAQAFADDLQAVLQSRPIAARALSLRLRSARWTRRHPAWATAIGALLLFASLLPLLLWEQARAANVTLAQEKARVERARVAADRARDSAERSFELSLAAIQQLLQRVGADRLRNVPAAQPIAAELLQDAIAFYDELQDLRPEAAVVGARRSDAMKELSNMLLYLGRSDDAKQVLEQALTRLGSDESRPARLERAQLHARIAQVELGRGDMVRADTSLTLAEQELLAASEAEDGVTTVHGLVHSLRAQLASRRGDQERAVANWRAALAANRAAAARPAADTETRRILGATCFNLAVALRDPANVDEAAQLIDEALRILAPLDDAHCSWPTPSMVRAMVLSHLAKVRELQGRTDDVEPAMLAAIDAFTAVVERYPDLPDPRSRRGGIRNNLALRLTQRRDYAGARPLLEAAVQDQRTALQQKPDDDDALRFLGNHYRTLMVALRELGDWPALIDASRAAGKVPGGPELPRGAARNLLRCAELAADAAAAQALRDDAMAFLLEADKRGWGNGRIDDDVYAPLRERPEFQALRERLQQRSRK